MLHDALYTYLRRECDALGEAWHQLRQKPGDATAIHEIRVGIKKIKAFFALAAALPGYSLRTGKYLHTLKLIQAIGGTSRDAQLKTKQLQPYEKQVAWRFSIAHLLLKNKLHDGGTHLQHTLKHTTLKQLDKLPEKFREAIADTDPIVATTVLLRHLTAQYAAIQPPAGRAHHTVWHTLRKNVKTLYYQLTILAPAIPASKELDRVTAHIKKAGELLGKWHDTSELLLFVKTSIAEVKQEKIPLPVRSGTLLKLLQQDTRQQLAQCKTHLQQGSAFDFTV
ncbi:CHAD domain-containing protein [Chitinophaga nivalis]|uniref:CHAD domain-containing protein n=1 Tax=Chitinophaga nivalis TaxID=2991709 RepID=A0ABT3IS95_9BACT|nr:CHAD domain-containing protein [Chitinophaga nivalis]MCW3463731.1 CHAD domain-containing protein [Chitinophaga nivalis]MCW3486579.1 CHAD domain-containing protein [Chitinophaga nivalis]